MITVFTSITGGKDNLLEEQNTEGAEFLAFVDKDVTSKTWKCVPAYDRFVSPRRNSRAPKILAHQFINTEYSIWLDGNVNLLVPAQTVVDEWLKDADIALCRHHARDCIYEEGQLCARYNLDDPGTILEQLDRYKKEGFGEHHGMGECTVMARRHTPKVEAFNNYWWAEHCRGSVRDQLSFMYAVDKAGIKVNFIQPNVYKHPFFKLHSHLTPRKE